MVDPNAKGKKGRGGGPKKAVPASLPHSTVTPATTEGGGETVEDSVSTPVPAVASTNAAAPTPQQLVKVCVVGII